jgi:diaminopimelate epimerase
MYLEFEKWHGCKNDFVVVRVLDLEKEMHLGTLKRQATNICDRHSGIGADGILVLHSKDHQDLTPYQLTIINSDGSVAQNCGNGLRCAALSVRKAHLEKGNPNEMPEIVEFDVEGRTFGCQFVQDRAKLPNVAVEMIVPSFNDELEWNTEVQDRVQQLAKELKFSVQQVTCCQVGNPHVVIDTPDNSEQLMLKVGKALQSGLSIDGINVHLVNAKQLTDSDLQKSKQSINQPIEELYEVWVWERGVGPTQACGSGACAVGAAGFREGFIERTSWVGIDMPGGRLYVKHPAEDEPVTLAGPAEFVYSGKLEI